MIKSKVEAIEKADKAYMDTGDHFHVVDFGGTYDFFCTAYFDNGFNGGKIVYSTWKTR